MNYGSVFRRVRHLFRSYYFLISAFWILGIILGICLANAYAYKSDGAVRLLISQPASPIWMLLISVIPIILIALFLWRASTAACCFVVTVEAISRGFCGMLILLAFGSGAWLVRSLFLFTSVCVSVLMWWLVFHYRHADHHCFKKAILICILSALIVSAVDIFYVSPFLLDLTKYI